ncbi:MAG: RDD family protein [Nocardioidaceae bacterium]
MSASPTPADPVGTTYPGQRLGLPAEGPGSVAGWGRRALALAIDWFACKLVLTVFIGGAAWTGGTSMSQAAPILMYLGEATLLTALVGGSFGQLVTRVVVVRLDNRPVNLLQALVRTFLVCLVIPPLVFNTDQRGLHDLAVKTVTLRR